MSSTLENALSLIQQGFHVLPLQANGKKPLGPWREMSSNDPAVVREWFKNEKPNLGIDCYKSGLVVIDVDDKDVEKKIKVRNEETGAVTEEIVIEVREGIKSVKELEDQGFQFGNTFMVDTTTRGYHLYYRAKGIANSESKVARHIDVRGDGGYVVAPGSTIDGIAYKIVLPEDPILPLPEWLRDRCSKSVPREDRKAEISLSEDADVDIAWAKDFLKTYPEAVEGAGGDQATYVLFCKLKERGLSMHTAIELAMENWNERCAPPWDIEELTIKAENAYAYAQNATGKFSPEVEFAGPPIIPISNTYPETLISAADFCPDPPRRKWIVDNWIPKDCVTGLFGPGGAGKSLLAQQLATVLAVNYKINGGLNNDFIE